LEGTSVCLGLFLVAYLISLAITAALAGLTPALAATFTTALGLFTALGLK
jgi:hypothetical protein